MFELKILNIISHFCIIIQTLNNNLKNQFNFINLKKMDSDGEEGPGFAKEEGDVLNLEDDDDGGFN